MPDWKNEIRVHLTGLKLEPAREAQILEELAQYLDDRYEELIASGSSEEQARRAVMAEMNDGRLGAKLKSVLRDMPQPIVPGDYEQAGLLSSLWKDVRYGARLLRLNPGFTTVAVLSLALGIGANTAIFQLLDAVRLRTLPVKDPQELADVRTVYTPHGRTGDFRGDNPRLTSALFEHIRDQQQGFSGLAAFSTQNLNLSPGGEARYARTLWVSGNFFDVLGVTPILGRALTPADDQRGCTSTGVVLSYSFWQSEFGGQPSALGRTLLLERHRFEVIGVTPSSFFGPEVGRTFDVALPLCAEPLINGEDANTPKPFGWWLAAIGRLKPRWTLERASAQLAAISPGIMEATLPPTYDAVNRKDYLQFRLGALPVAYGFSSLRTQYESSLWLLMAISGLVLLIACANLANLMIARSSAREREMAVRLALGASRSRLVRQLLAESMILAVIGAIFGAALAQVLSRLLVAFLKADSTTLFVDLHPDWRVLGFTVGLAFLTCIVFGLAPALQASSTAPSEAMKAGGRGVVGVGRFGFRRVLVISQVALSLVLLVGALLFVRTFINLVNLDAGFQQDHVFVSDIDFTSLNLPVDRRIAFKQELLARVRALPGVGSAASALIIPVGGSGWNDSVNVESTNVHREISNFNRVSAEYFRTLGTPLLAGRDFNSQDTAHSPLVAIVNQTFAKKYLPNTDPLGKTLGVVQDANKPDIVYQIIGVVKDAKYSDLREDFTPTAFLAETQDPHPIQEARIVIRSDELPSSLVAGLRRVVADINPDLVLNFSVFKTTIRQGLVREQLMATLAGFFGVLAIVLAMIGLYGVISYMVVRRRNEIGIRMALGANQRNIVAMVIREAAKLLIIGLVIGTALAIAAGPTARALLFGLKAHDPLTLISAVVALTLVALIASFLPAQRAARLDPLVALREE